MGPMIASPGVAAVEYGKRLQYFTIFYNCLEAVVSLAAGFVAGSVSLVGFGLDSLIEVTSGGAALWRLHRDESAERVALRIVGWCFVALSAYVAFEAARSLWTRSAPEHSIVGIAIATASLVVMPLLARAKRRVAGRLGSRTMAADARQTDFCTWLSAILLGGLLLNAALGWWWADPAAALAMSPIIAREGVDALRGDPCRCH